VESAPDELHFQRLGGIDPDDRAEVATFQAMRRKIGVEHDDVEFMKAHRESPG
jgi:hypothetical protein